MKFSPKSSQPRSGACDTKHQIIYEGNVSRVKLDVVEKKTWACIFYEAY